MSKNSWAVYEGGKTIGAKTIDGGLILHDESHNNQARITLKRDKTFVSVSFTIYGWIEHSRFFNTDADAQREYRAMKPAIISMVEMINAERKDDLKVWEAISDFVRRFP